MKEKILKILKEYETLLHHEVVESIPCENYNELTDEIIKLFDFDFVNKQKELLLHYYKEGFKSACDVLNNSFDTIKNKII